MIRGLVADGTTVLLTTQYLEEADQLAHDIAVIDHGVGHRDGDAGRAQGERRAAGPRGDPGQPGRPERRSRSCSSCSPARRRPSPSSPARSASRSRAAGRCRASCARSTTGPSSSPSSRCAGRASTRCSSRSPATAPKQRHRPEAGKGGKRPLPHANLTGAPDDHGHALPVPPPRSRRLARRPSPATAVANSFTLAWRQRAQDQDQPGGPLRALAPADHVPGPVHLRVRRRDRRRHAPVPAVLAARHPGALRGLRHPRHRHDAQPGHRHRRLRPVPRAADRPLGAAGRRDPRRPGAVRDLDPGDARLRLRPRVPRADERAGGRAWAACCSWRSPSRCAGCRPCSACW